MNQVPSKTTVMAAQDRLRLTYLQTSTSLLGVHSTQRKLRMSTWTTEIKLVKNQPLRYLKLKRRMKRLET